MVQKAVVARFCGKLLLPHTPNTHSHQSRLHVIIPWPLTVYLRAGPRGVPKNNFNLEYPWNLVKWQNATRDKLKKISQLKSDIRSYRCKKFSLKQSSGLMRGGGGVRAPETATT